VVQIPYGSMITHVVITMLFCFEDSTLLLNCDAKLIQSDTFLFISCSL